MIKVVFFDFNNTLMNTTTPQVITEYLGKGKEREKYEEQYKAGILSKNALSEQSLALYKGFSLSGLKEIIRQGKFIWNKHVKECLAGLRKRKIKAVIITNEDVTIMKEICMDMGFDDIKGSVLEMKDNKYTGQFVKFSDSKDRVVKETIKELGLTKHEALAVGDSPSDAVMFKEVGVGVLYNPDVHAKGKGDHEIQDFKELITLVDTYNKKGCRI
ncbi:HAD family phosphatase [Candidatus Woesearchaeota archaeon]|nr:HAD family phosphatase [Candidatus Woesearchaeota archaeon]